MSTRGLYNFGGDINVYCHHDNYPSGAAARIADAYQYAWELPRYEPDEFAAAFVSGNKTRAGGVRIMPSGDPVKIAKKNCADIEFIYIIREVAGVIYVKAIAWHWDSGEMIYDGPVSGLVELQERLDARELAGQ